MAARVKRVTLLTNHACVVLAIVALPHITVREMAGRLGITERATYALLRQLEDAGYLTRPPGQRRPARKPVMERPLEGAMLQGWTLGDLIGALRGRTR